MTMIEINLLPKQYKKRRGGFSLGKNGTYAVIAVAGILLMVGAITLYQIHQINEIKGQMEIARARTTQLQKDIQLVDALIDIKTKITERMEAVEELDRHRSAWVRILEDISRNVPDFVWLSNFGEAAPPSPPTTDTTAATQPATLPRITQVNVEGFTFTLNALASFMIKMMRSDYFDDVDLLHTEQIAFGKQKAYNFQLSCNVHYLSDEELERLAAQETAASNGSIN
ncbi:MAG: PilN domain-containing protein [Candidatus Zixiibacteriota bacterium]|nr:MAG: PilN domain-containing protein [candidate division Zixibacteria bacterium]